MRVALIGGTGFVGGYLVDALLEAGHDVSLLVRRGSEGKVQADVWRTISGDTAEDSAVAATVAECDAVIYNVGILRESPRQGITFESLQFDGVVRAVEAAKNAGVRRFLLMSANGAKVPGTPYQETKKRAEDHVLSSGLDATVFRPSVIFGDPKGKWRSRPSCIATSCGRPFLRRVFSQAKVMFGCRPFMSTTSVGPSSTRLPTTTQLARRTRLVVLKCYRGAT